MFHLRQSVFLVALFLCQVMCQQLLFKEGEFRYSTIEGTFNKLVKDVVSINSELLPRGTVAAELYGVEKIPNLYPGAISNLPRLWQIQMKNCGILNLSPGAFSEVPNLTVLKLQDNNLTSISAGVFNRLNLTRLLLHRNLIETIDAHAFDDMVHLRLIKLNYNFIKAWNSEWFRNCPMLTDIYFRRNEIAYLPEHAFKNIKGIHEIEGELILDTRIYLSNNYITRIHPNALANLEQLDELWLDRNQLCDLDLDLFSNIKRLNRLSLGSNNISSIRGTRFAKLTSMDTLDLTKNNLTCVPLEMVSVCKRVLLQRNPIDCGCLKTLRARVRPGQTRLQYKKC